MKLTFLPPEAAIENIEVWPVVIIEVHKTIVFLRVPEEGLDPRNNMTREAMTLCKHWDTIFRLAYYRECLGRFFKSKQMKTEISPESIAYALSARKQIESDPFLSQIFADELQTFPSTSAIVKNLKILTKSQNKVTDEDLDFAQGYAVSLCEDLENLPQPA